MTDHSNASDPDELRDELRADVARAVPLETEVARDTVTVRRAPKYSRFLTLGALLGAVVALILTVAFPDNDEFDKGQVFGFLLLACATVGVALGAVVALLIDRASARRAKAVTAEHETIHPVDE
ncbi:potassium transporter Trk [Agromyces badenianii]|uniref:potassium transporter Trk n=1 Tax=Agromyces badenianii TaxID=2080742 RepID=UPI001F357AD5|nr:potassium transporter Trk [Agromyces badenianii]